MEGQEGPQPPRRVRGGRARDDVACHGTSTTGAWEVRRIGGKFTVTVGDLFQSQTVWCPDVDVMLAVLNRALNGRRNQPLPDGAELLQAPKKRP